MNTSDFAALLRGSIQPAFAIHADQYLVFGCLFSTMLLVFLIANKPFAKPIIDAPPHLFWQADFIFPARSSIFKIFVAEIPPPAAVYGADCASGIFKQRFGVTRPDRPRAHTKKEKMEKCSRPNFYRT